MVLAVSKARIPTVEAVLDGSERRRPRRPSSESHNLAVIIADDSKIRRRFGCNWYVLLDSQRLMRDCREEGLNLKGFGRPFPSCCFFFLCRRAR